MTANSRPYWWISLALLALSGGLAAVYLGPTTALPQTGRSLADRNWLRVAYATSLQADPQVRLFPVSVHNFFLLSLWEPLVECDPLTGQPQPAAAESWSWSDDFKTLTLKLNPGSHWSNGDPVTAADFVRGWLRLLRGSIDTAYTLFPLKNAEAFRNGKLPDPAAVGVHAVDALTLQIELDRPRMTFVSELADPLLSPLHATNESVFKGSTYLTQPSALVTNGPFYLTEVRGDGFRLAKCPVYHDRDRVKLDGVQFILAGSLAIGELLVASGRADLLSPMEPGDEDLRWTGRPLTVDSEMVLGVMGIFFNVTRGPLHDPRVRRALALALDRAHSIPESARHQMVPAWSWVPDMPGRKGLKLLEENAGEARRLLAEAGYPGGKGFPVLQLPMPKWIQGEPYTAACCDRWFRELGVKTYVAYRSPEENARHVAAGDYDVSFGTMFATAPDPGDLLSAFIMPAQYSEARAQDDEAIRIFSEASLARGQARADLLEQGERHVMSELYAVPLMFARRHVLHATEVQGWYADALARQSPKRLWLASPAGPEDLARPRL